MSLYKFFVAPDPMFIDPIYGTVHKYDIYTKEPSPIYQTIAVFVSWADAFNFINKNNFEINEIPTPSWNDLVK